MKPKKEKKILKTFSIHETNVDMARYFKKAILTYKHLENMLNILVKQECDHVFSSPKEKRDFTYFNLLLNKMIMKAVICNNSGAEKTEKQIAMVNEYFKGNEIFNQMKELGNILNDKNISMIVERLKKDWKNSFSNLKNYHKKPSNFTGKPSIPKTKKIKLVYNYSVPLEPDKFSMKKDCFGVTIYKKQKKVFLRDNEYVQNKNINGLTVSLSHGHIYYYFNYEVEKVIKQDDFSLKNRPVKHAGMDIGVINLFALFINDFTSQSLIYSNKKLIKYNMSFNKELAKLNAEIAQQVSKYKEVKKEQQTNKYPEEYTTYGIYLKNKRSQLFNSRNLFFDGELNKISSNLLTLLKQKGVTHLALSKNLSFVKTTGRLRFNKSTQQKFYQIPFGKFLNLLIAKSHKFNIDVELIDEAYTSKTSSLTANVGNVVQLRKNNLPITSNELNGVRGVKGNKIGRGMFKDTVINKVINSDINGAANHVKVGFPNLQFLDYRNHLNKVCNPIKIKSSNEFSILLNS